MSGVAKVTFNGQTLIDVTDKTVTAAKMLNTGTALDKAGDSITGSIASKSSSDLTVSGATVTAPAGYYSSSASKSVASGSAGTPTASKGSVSNHSISVTPSVTNTTGYITGSTKTGTAVTVSASELVSGNKSITSNGTGIDVANYSTVSVAVPTSTVNNQDKTVSPSTSQQSVTADSGYTGLGTVTVNAMPTMTLPTALAQTHTGTSKATIDPMTFDTQQYLNIPTGYNSTASYYAIKGVALQEKTVTPSTMNQVVLPDTSLGFNGLSKVTVNAMAEGSYGDASWLKIKIPVNAPTQLSVGASYLNFTSGYFANAPSAQTLFTLQNETVTPSTTTQTITPTSTSYYLNSVTVNPMPSGTAGTPNATKGTVSNHQVSVTPSVTNTTGYITGGTKTGTAVTVTASELASGNKAITSNGSGIDVVGYSTVSVDVPTGGGINNQDKTVTPTTSQQQIQADTGYTGLGTVTVNAMPNGTAGTPTATTTISGHTALITPKVTNIAGYITGGTKNGTLFSITAGDLVSGNLVITENGSNINVTNYETVTVNVSDSPQTTYTATIVGTGGDSSYLGVELNNVKHYLNGDSFTFTPGDTLSMFAQATTALVNNGEIKINGTTVASSQGSKATYNYTLPAKDVEISLTLITQSSANHIAVASLIELSEPSFEYGTYVPTQDIARPTISFSKTHTSTPAMISFTDTSVSTFTSIAANSSLSWSLVDWEGIGNVGIPSSASATIYARADYNYLGTGTSATTSGTNITQSHSATGSSSTSYFRYWADENGFKPYSGSSTRYWRAGHVYRWMAVWK